MGSDQGSAEDQSGASQLGTDACLQVPAPGDEQSTLSHRASTEVEAEASQAVSADVLDALYRHLFQMEVEAEEKRRSRVGDDDHPINVEKIKESLGCLPICEVEIDFDLRTMRYTVRHRVPAHERVFKIYDRYGFFKREEKQEFRQERSQQISIDPYMLDRYRGDADHIAREIIKQMRGEWNYNWPHHA